jgi:hypothetical protein
MGKPTERHWAQVKSVLRYLAGTRDYALEYRGGASTGRGELEGYVDADFAACRDTRRSRTGYLFMLYGGAVSWQSKLQPVVAMSTAEAEYVAGAMAAREGVWLRRICTHLDLGQSGPLAINIDNQSALHMATNSSDSARTKHIDLRYHYLRQSVERGAIRLRYIPTDKNAADIFTKPLAEIKFKAHCRAMGIVSPAG